VQGNAIMRRMPSGPKRIIDRWMASSLKLLGCLKLTHWKVEEKFNRMFEFERDYMPWICLRNIEPLGSLSATFSQLK
jgi:hypothetical protein